MFVCMYICIYSEAEAAARASDADLRSDTYKYVYVCVCMYVYVYVFIYIHAYIDTYSRACSGETLAVTASHACMHTDRHT